MTRSVRQRAWLEPVLIVLLAGAALVSLWLGAVNLSLAEFFAVLFPAAGVPSPDLEKYGYIVFQIRMPRLVGAVVAGMSLATSGVLMQGLFRNPLAGPEVLGVSSGASLGAVIAISAGAVGAGLFVLPLAATIGAFLCAGFIYLVAAGGRSVVLLQVILAGMAVSGLLNGVISTVLLFSDQYQLGQFVFWTMGGLQGRMWDHVLWPLVLVLPAMAAAFASRRKLDILALGEEQAHATGLGIEKEKRILLVISAVLTAMAISIAGPIGFIGLMVPHLCRLLAGPDHRRLLPLSALAGALVLVLADLAGRTLVAPLEIQVGIITALSGSPFFLWLVLRSRRRQS